MKDLYMYIYQNKSLEECPDMPAVLPSTENHVWGRAIELGRLDIEVIMS